MTKADDDDDGPDNADGIIWALRYVFQDLLRYFAARINK